MVGQTVGKYRVLSRLGRGGMGTVYKAVDETLGREVAIKSLHPDVADREVLKRFRAEAVTLARLNHPNIATLFELTDHDGDLLMVMEFVNGETFDQLSDRTGPMPLTQATQLCVQVLDALGHAHRAGIVHRDLKPANLMLAESGLVKVMDFGIARMAGTEHLTTDGYMMGTPAYMAPEQILGKDVDGRADLYSMGVVFYRLLTGQLPFKADTGIAMVQKQINDVPTPLRQLRPELQWECEVVLAKALSKRPADRYQSADEFKTALGVLTFGGRQDRVKTTPPIGRGMAPIALDITMPATPTPAVGFPTSPPAPAIATRRSKIPLTVAALLVLGLAIGIPSAWLWRRSHPTPVSAVPSVAARPITNVISAPVGEPAALPSPPTEPPAAPERPAASGTSPAKAAAVDAPPSPTVDAPAPAKTTVAPLLFDGVKLLTFEQSNRTREQDATLRLGPDSLDVLDGAKALNTVAYRTIVAIFHSHSKEPRWATPDGTAVSVAKVGGKFAFLKGDPDWITIRTKSAFIPIRAKGGSIDELIKGIEQRTGVRVTRVDR